MTINEIRNNLKKNEKSKKLFELLHPAEIFSFVPAEVLELPLEIVAQTVKMPWGRPFPVDELIETAKYCEKQTVNPTLKIIPLWEKQSEEFIPTIQTSTKESVAILTTDPDGVQGKPAVIICPGGGYESLSVNNEGIQMAKAMQKAGYHAFVLLYRLKPNEYPKPQIDLALAVKYVRRNAEKYGIDPNNLMLMGSSAGGHLCASMALEDQEIEKMLMKELTSINALETEKYQGISIRPNKLCLNYPVISLVTEHHEPSALALLGDRFELREKLSIDQQLGADWPKTFVWTCEDDGLVPASNAKRLGAAMEKMGVEHRLEIFPTGDHGCGLAYGTSAESWMSDMLEFMEG